MATKSLKLTTVTAVLALVTSTELLGWLAVRHLGGSPLFWLGGLRLVQIGALVWIVVKLEKGLDVIGWQLSAWRQGLWKGVIWSAGFGLIAGCAMAVLYWTGRNPLAIVQSPLLRENHVRDQMSEAPAGVVGPQSPRQVRSRRADSCSRRRNRVWFHQHLAT